MIIPATLLPILRLAVLNRPGNLTECYYIDHSDKTIFSIHMADYFMLNEDMDVIIDAQTGYTKEETTFIANKIKKLERKAANVTRIPTFSLQETKSIIEYFIGLKFNHPEIHELKAEEASFDKNIRKSLMNLFDSISDDFLKEDWMECLHSKADEKINAFILKEGIDINLYKQVRLGNGSITVKVSVDSEKPNALVNKVSSVFLIALAAGIILFILCTLLLILGITNGFVPP